MTIEQKLKRRDELIRTKKAVNKLLYDIESSIKDELGVGYHTIDDYIVDISNKLILKVEEMDVVDVQTDV